MRNIKGFYGSRVAKLPNYFYRKSDNIHKAVSKKDCSFTASAFGNSQENPAKIYK